MRTFLLLLVLCTMAHAQLPETDFPLGVIPSDDTPLTVTVPRDHIRVGMLEATTVTQLTTVTLTTSTLPRVVFKDDGTTLTVFYEAKIMRRVRVPGAFRRRVLAERNYYRVPWGYYYRPMTKNERVARGINY